MTKRMLADVMWQAANNHLRSREDWSEPGNKSKFSCDAASMALGQLGPYSKEPSVVATMKFLRSLGLLSCESLIQFQSFRAGPERQGVRYMWLLLAMHVAEDEGIAL